MILRHVFAAQPAQVEDRRSVRVLDLGEDDSRLYRGLDQLHALKDTLYAHPMKRYESWFGVEFEFLLYDVTSTDLVSWDIIPELTGIAGTGDLVGVDLTPWLPPETNRTRFFRVEEE